MVYDAVKLKDWQISELAEEKMPTPSQWQEKLGLKNIADLVRHALQEGYI